MLRRTLTRRAALAFGAALLVVAATNLAATAKTYYVDPAGSDNQGDGSKRKPWKTLAHAVKNVPTAQAHTIHLNQGIFTETVPSIVPPGISIEGEGADKTVIKSGIDDFLLQLESAPVVEGNQILSNFKIEGQNRNLKGGIFVRGRHNVIIRGVDFEEIDFTGLQIIAEWTSSRTTPPATYLNGIEVDNCNFKNCSKDLDKWSSGCLHIGGLKEAKIHDIKIQEDRGYGIKFFAWGWFKGIKIYNCELAVPDSDPLWKADSALELWRLFDDCEIYNVKSNQWFSLVGGDKGKGTRSVTVHDCEIIVKRSDEQYLQGIEATVSDSEFYNNYFENPGSFGAFAMWGGEPLSNILIHHNIVRGGTNTNALAFVQSDDSADFSDIKFYNNLCENLEFGVKLKPVGTGEIRKVEIKNNIFIDVKTAILAYNAPNKIRDTAIAFNCFYQVEKTFKEEKGKTVNTNFENNIEVDPELIGSGKNREQYYKPKSAKSPVVDAGIEVGLPYKGKAPDMGVYEY
ncbi:right-handed parallel beta-helix repeat-containing protein [Microcoleus sp. FACHB-672]|uniref:right-handed parallel beta-helix repeat-containing protein n=1 Tax=Microcoleus sp. FACHB-672 TaxID=2692825 RepID=UPI001687F037|nr:right-handed parallel beta-helix repeat-containing protein [Microcoleus sp. FACHB-672]MBD2042239.1 DUF1565 domain-containing protein [Microcoleus sp. FACHB-672]